VQAERTSDASMQAAALHGLGVNEISRKNYDAAFDLLVRALEIRRGLPSRNVEEYTLNSLVTVERARGRLEEALRYSDRAVAIMESMRRRVDVDDLRAAVQGWRWAAYGRNIDILTRLHAQTRDPQYASRAFAVSERARARSLLDLMNEEQVDLRRDVPEELRASEEAAELRLADLQRRLLAARTSGAPAAQTAALDAELSSVEQGLALLQIQMRTRDRAYAAVAYPSPLDAGQVMAQLDPDTALLEYTIDASGSALFVVTDRELRAIRLRSRVDIERLVGDVRTGLSSPGRREFSRYVRAARELFEALVTPALDAIGDRASLIVVPHGALHYLPFEALLTGEGAASDPGALPYLVRRWTVAYAPSASVLAELRDRARNATQNARRSSLLAAADPTLQPVAVTPAPDGGRSPRETPWNLAPLPNARSEIARVASRFPPDAVETLVGDAAREDRVTRGAALGAARYVHFATHGVVDEEHPARSALLLASGSDSKADGLLQAREIFKLRLTADLVVLSACESALGRAITGEGLMSLPRAFLFAGAAAVVSSLWRVADESTPELMAGMYNGLSRERGRAQALREAKLALIDGGRWSHPYYWAPFTLIGIP
jgi:CHAT domain-containing protein